MDLNIKTPGSSGQEIPCPTPDGIEPYQKNSSAAGIKRVAATSQSDTQESPDSELVADEESIVTLKALPNEVLIKIFSYLSLREILELSRVCWNFNLISKDVSLWRQTEAEISSNEELQNFCRFFRLCYIVNTRENTTVRHPYEALTQIYSYLSKTEILDTSVAIWKFNDHSKNATLWQMIKIIIRCNEKLKIFLSVMDQTTPIKCLSLLFRPREPSGVININRPNFKVESTARRIENSDLNEFFKQSRQLYCLNLQNLDLASMILPPTVKHISISLNRGPKGNENTSANTSCLDAVSQLSLLRHCPNTIEHLGLYAHRRYVELTKSIKDLLIKFQHSLTSLHIDTLHTNKDLIPLIINCCKLKDLGLYLYDVYDPEEEVCYRDISHQLNLQSLTLKTEHFQSYSPHIFQERGFSQLVYFHVNCEQSHLRKTDFKALLSSTTHLETFLYNARVPHRDGDISTEDEHWEDMVIDFYEFIKNCVTLKHVGIDLSSFHNKPKAFLVKKMIPLQKQRNYESVCLCKLIFKGPNEKLFHAKELCETLRGSCKTCMCSVDESFKCSCWKRGREHSRGYKRHLDYEHVNLSTLELYDLLIDRELAVNEGRVHSESYCYFTIR